MRSDSPPPPPPPRRPRAPRSPFDNLPDVRDGLNRLERLVLFELYRLEKELKGRNVPTAMLYGRVCEHIPITERELQAVLQRFIGPQGGSSVRGSSPFRPGEGE